MSDISRPGYVKCTFEILDFADGKLLTTPCRWSEMPGPNLLRYRLDLALPTGDWKPGKRITVLYPKDIPGLGPLATLAYRPPLAEDETGKALVCKVGFETIAGEPIEVPIEAAETVQAHLALVSKIKEQWAGRPHSTRVSERNARIKQLKSEGKGEKETMKILEDEGYGKVKIGTIRKQRINAKPPSVDLR